MKLMSQTLVLLLAFLASTSHAQNKSPFDAWDKNDDGKLTKDELPPNVRRNFEKVDTNKDGFISREEDSAFRRRNAKRGTQSKRAPANENIEIKNDIAYAGTDNPRQKLDLYLPKKRTTEKPLPLIAFIHGGGWRNGDKRGGLRRVAALVESGEFVGVSIGYRLTGEAIWPAQIHDCKAAIRWLRAHAEEFGFAPDRIAVMGSSAGGHLVAMLGTSGDVAKLEGKLGKHNNVSSRVNCVIDEYGPTNFLTMNDFPGTMDHLAAESPESKLLGQQITKVPELVRKASPVTYVTKDDPPILIIHGTKDPLVPYQQSVVFADALKKAGVPVILQRIENGEHGGFGSEEVNARTKAFLNKYLLGLDVVVSTEPITVEQRRRN
jgi:acetyl esterase/lipase